MNKSTVSLCRWDDIPETPLDYTDKSINVIKQLLEKIVSLLPNFKNLVRGKKVLVKPNLVRPYLSSSPAITTDPRVMVSLVQLLKDCGTSEIAIGDNPGYGLKGRTAFKIMDLNNLFKPLDVRLIPFDDCETVVKKNPRAYVFKEIEFPKPIFEYDILLNLPKMKTHMHTIVSLGMKNMQGVILDQQRMLYHREDIHHKIVDTVLLAYPHFTIIDGIWAMEGQAPFFGNTVKNMNTIIAGENMVAVDTIAAITMGFFPDEITTLRLAREMGFMGTIPSEIVVKGMKTENITRKFKRPVLSSSGVFPNVRCIQAGACSGCMSALRHSLDKLKFENKLAEQPKVTIVSGRPGEDFFHSKAMVGDVWLFGDCAMEIIDQVPGMKQSCFKVKGCPPHVLDLYKWFCSTYHEK